jgi:hypothetical protein
MIRITVHRKFADGSPSLSVLPRRAFKTFEGAANAAMRLLADETRQPGHERVAAARARSTVYEERIDGWRARWQPVYLARRNRALFATARRSRPIRIPWQPSTNGL